MALPSVEVMQNSADHLTRYNAHNERVAHRMSVLWEISCKRQSKKAFHYLLYSFPRQTCGADVVAGMLVQPIL